MQKSIRDFYYLSNKLGNLSLLEQYSPPLKGPIYVLSKVMRNAVALAAELEWGALFLNGQ